MNISDNVHGINGMYVINGMVPEIHTFGKGVYNTLMLILIGVIGINNTTKQKRMISTN